MDRDDLRPVAELKRDTEQKERFWTWNHMPFIYTVLLGYSGLLFCVIWWAAHLQTEAGLNTNYRVLLQTDRGVGILEQVHDHRKRIRKLEGHPDDD